MTITGVVPEVDASDPYERAPQTFPRLSPEQAARSASFGTEERVSAGALLFERGQRGVDFFVVLEGSIEIFDFDEHGEARVFVVLGERQFTGELHLLNDRQNLLNARAATECRLVRVKHPDFRRLVTAEPDVGEMIMRAFILRRVGMIRYTQGGVVVIGPGHAADTLRLQRFLARTSAHVHMLVRGKGLAASMSDYLVQRIAASPKITLHTETEITAFAGDTLLRSVTWTNRATNASETRPVGNVFTMLGAVPNTEWLAGCLALDDKGFVVTGSDAQAESSYDTSRPGLFAVGDVRSGSTKRVASGGGDPPPSRSAAPLIAGARRSQRRARVG